MITTYNRGTREYKALKVACEMLNYTAIMNNATVYYGVDDTYFDFGQEWKWTTIIAYDGDSEWQALNPNEHKLITEDMSLEAITKAVNMVWDSPYNPAR